MKTQCIDTGYTIVNGVMELHTIHSTTVVHTAPKLNRARRKKPLFVQDFLNDCIRLVTFGTSWRARMSEDVERSNLFEKDLNEEDNFGFSIQPVTENRFEVEEFMTPDCEEAITEYIKNDILDQLDYTDGSTNNSRSPQQRQLAYDYWTEQLLDAQTPGELAIIGQHVHKAIANSLVTITNRDGESIEVPSLFPKGHLSMFWEFYNTRKEELRNQAVAEMQEIFAETYDIQEWKSLKQSIYHEPSFTYSEKKLFWDYCDAQIEKLELTA